MTEIADKEASAIAAIMRTLGRLDDDVARKRVLKYIHERSSVYFGWADATVAAVVEALTDARSSRGQG